MSRRGSWGIITASKPVSSVISLCNAWTGSSLGSICPPGGRNAPTLLCQ